MSQKSQPDPTEPSRVPAKTERHPGARLIWALTAIVLLTLALCCVFAARHETPKPFVWMTPAKLAQTLRPGRLTLLKYKVLRLPGPWRWFASKKQQIQVEMPLMTFSPEAAEQARLETQCITNTDGMRAWILSREDLRSFRLHLAMDAPKRGRIEDLPGPTVESAMRLTTYDGGHARISQGNALPILTNLVFCGVTVDLLPKVANGSFSLLVGITSTEAISSPSGSAVSVRTNFDAACRVLVPNSGGLVVDAGKGSDGKGTNFWFIITPVAVDPAGNAVSLPSPYN